MKLVGIDIETVSIVESFYDLSEQGQTAWERKMAWKEVESDEELAELWKTDASKYAEFSKICSFGWAWYSEEDSKIYQKSVTSDDEVAILKVILREVAKVEANGGTLVAHGGKFFDYPYIFQRLRINRLTVPRLLDNADKKPWTVEVIDTQDIWKCGGTGSGASLETLCFALGLDSPKTEINGANVGKYFYNNQFDLIGKYCGTDASSCLNCYFILMGGEAIEVEVASSKTYKAPNPLKTMANTGVFSDAVKGILLKADEEDLEKLERLVYLAYVQPTDKVAEKKSKKEEISQFIKNNKDD